MKKIWICGSHGMLASHFVRLLKQNQTPFLATTHQQVDITQQDIVSDLVRKEKVTHIINCAAYTHVDQAEIEEKQAYLINAIGPHNLAVAARRHRAHVTHFSTDYVFDGQSRTPYTEDHLCRPIGAYGMSKLAGEIKLMDEHQHVCIVRSSWLYGLPGKNFVQTVLNLMNEKEELRVISDQIGRPTYCQDLAEVTLQLLGEEGIFHFANAMEASWYSFATEIYHQAKQLGYSLKVQSIHPITTHQYPTLAKRPPYSTLNTQKLEKKIGKTPRPWQEALHEYLVIYKKHQETKPLKS